MIYLASPYSHPQRMIRLNRYYKTLRYTGYAMSRGSHIFSPIVYAHHLAEHHNLPKDFDWWQRFDTHMIKVSEGFRVLTLEGWEESKGVQAEIEIATSFGHTVTYVDWEETFAHIQHG